MCADNRILSQHAVVTTKTTNSKKPNRHRGHKNEFKKARKEQLLVVVNCGGGGVRVSAAIDDRNEALWGIVPNVLAVRSKKAVTSAEREQLKKNVFCDKFEGHQHSTKLEINGHKLGHYFYRYIGNKTAVQVHRYLQECKLMRKTPDLPYGGDNIRVAVVLAGKGDLLPMNAVFSDNEIIELAIGKDWRAKAFQREFDPFQQEKFFFWGNAADEHEDLSATVAAARAALTETEDF